MSFFLGIKKRRLSDKLQNGEDSRKQKTVIEPARYQMMFILVTVSIQLNVLKY